MTKCIKRQKENIIKYGYTFEVGNVFLKRTQKSIKYKKKISIALHQNKENNSVL